MWGVAVETVEKLRVPVPVPLADVRLVDVSALVGRVLGDDRPPGGEAPLEVAAFSSAL